MNNTIKKAIRNIPDFPKKGIQFKDITPLLLDAALFTTVIEELKNRYQNQQISKVVAIEARGFIFGAPLAIALGAGFVPIRKKGKLPYKTYGAQYALEYGTAEIEIHQDALSPQDKVLLVDDLLATGGTTQAALALISQSGANVEECVFLCELAFLKGREKITEKVHSLMVF